MIQGYLHPEFWRVGELFEKLVHGFPGGAAACVYHDGEKVVDIWGGVMDEQGTPWREDTMAVSFSTTKGISSTALHVCADRGLIDYDAPVSRYWPEFAQNGKESVTVKHVLTHQAGLHGIRRMIEHAGKMLDWDHMVDTLARARPHHTPGTGSAYHALTYGWLVGELVRRVSGKPLAEFLQTEVAKPLGLDGLYVGVPEQELHRSARLVDSMRAMKKVVRDGKPGEKHRSGTPRAHRIIGAFRATAAPFHALAAKGVTHFDFSAPEAVSAQIPAAGGVFTARSLAKLYGTLAAGGEMNGVRLLSRRTLDTVTQVHLRGRDRVIPIDMRWRLGYHAGFTTRGIHPGAYGHYGFGGSGGLACPAEKTGIGLVVNGGVGSNVLGDLRMPRLAGAVVESLRHRGRVRAKIVDMNTFRKSA